MLDIEPDLLEFDRQNKDFDERLRRGLRDECEPSSDDSSEEFASVKDWNPKSNNTDPKIHLLNQLHEDSEVKFEDWHEASAQQRKVLEGFQLAIARLNYCREELRTATSNRLCSPAFYLSFGLHLIRSRSEKSLYRDYANLLNIAYQAFGKENIECGEEAVRKIFRRFMKRNPEAFRIGIASGVSVSLSMIVDERNR